MKAQLTAALLAAALLGAASAQAAPAGEAQYLENCAACHQPAGEGIPGAFPALAGNAFVTGDPKQVINTVLNGRGGMPAFKSDLTDDIIAGAITYIRGAFNKAAPVTTADVHTIRDGPAPDLTRPLQAH